MSASNPTITLLPHSFTLRQDSWLDYWLSQCLLHCSLTQPHPLQHPVACRLLLKPVCSSPGCQSFPVLVVLLFYAPPPSPLTSLLPLSAVAFLDFLYPGGALKIENRDGCGEEKAQRSARSIFVCHLSHYFHCSAAVTAAHILMKRRPLWSLLHSARADIFLSCLPLKCPFCVSYW